MEEVQDKLQKLQSTVHKAMRSFDSTHVRKLQMAAYMCATNCFADRTRPAEHTDKCVQSCMAPVQNISKLLQFHGKDINGRFQQRQQLCQSASNDLIQDGVATLEAEKAYAACLSKAVDDVSPLVDAMQRRLGKQIADIPRPPMPSSADLARLRQAVDES